MYGIYHTYTRHIPKIGVPGATVVISPPLTASHAPAPARAHPGRSNVAGRRRAGRSVPILERNIGLYSNHMSVQTV
jgi:hypothetical protein